MKYREERKIILKGKGEKTLLNWIEWKSVAMKNVSGQDFVILDILPPNSYSNAHAKELFGGAVQTQHELYSDIFFCFFS